MAVKDEDDAEEKDNAEGSEEGAGKKSKKKLIIIIAAALVLLGGAGAGAFFFLGKKGDTAETEAAEEAPAGEHGEAAEGDHGGKPGKAAKAGMPTFYELPEFLVNLNTDGKGLSFIKMTVVLEVPGAKDVESLDALQPRVVNDFNTYLRELRASDLAGSTGLERLREELLMRVNKSVAPVQVSDILFKEIVVQ